MPFKSKAQQAYMFIHHKDIAKEMASKTPNFKGLPEHARKAGKTAATRQARARRATKKSG